MKEIILAACGAWVWVHKLKVQLWAKFLFRKPFACEVCMAGWFALLLFLLPPWADIPFYMAGAMVATVLLTKIIR